MFLQNKEFLLKQFKTFYQSYLFSNLDVDTDIIVFTDDMSITLPIDVKKFYYGSISNEGLFKDYHYINSVSCIADNPEIISSYDFILKTDVDIFLTPNFKNFYPNLFHCGVGHYANSEDIRNKLKNIAHIFGLRYQNKTNVGATWYGNSNLIIDISKKTVELSEYMFEKETFVEWPGWYKGVVSMYSSDIAVNHFVDDFIISEKFDTPSDLPIPSDSTYHIHCFHTDKLFSKYFYENDKYVNIVPNNSNDIPNYCLHISKIDLK